MSSKTLYIGPFVHSKSLETLDICPNGTIGVDEQGKIAFVNRNAEGSRTKDWENAKIVRIEGNQFFFPGFIDTHIHASQYPNAGIFGKSTLLDWLNTYTFPLEGSFQDTKIADKVYNRVVSRTLSHGTTTACYYATNHVPATNTLADICLAKGQRAFIGRVCMDRLSPENYRDESPATAYEASKECIEYVKKIDPAFELITPIITPRFAPSCTHEALTEMGRLYNETKVPCQTHIAENLPEIELVKEMFPNSKSYSHVYDSYGLLHSQMILAHAVHLSIEERALIKARDAKISHCPASNTALTSGRAKVRSFLNEGITVGLGTDVSGGYTPSMLVEAREAVFVSRHVAMDDGPEAKLSVDEALYLATLGGAKVVGLEGRIGNFEVGKDWDAQLVNLGSINETADLDQSTGLVDIFGEATWAEKIEKWMYTGDDRNTMAVWVNGRLVHGREGCKP